MSDKRIVAGDKRIGADDMSTAAAESYRILDELTHAYHRGRGDTWEAARGRVADDAGIPVSYAARLWHRWEEMKKADGDVLLALQRFKARYDAACDRMEGSADAMRAERLELKARRHAHVVGRPEMARRMVRDRD